MANFKFKLNRAGVRELLLSDGMVSALKSHASDVKANAGEGYGISVYQGRNRANVSVRTKTKKAKKDNLKKNTLLKAVHK